MKNKKGFTLIELLAVIVILGLLMAIAIPSVTKYITESRKKTITSTIGNYIGALVNDVNDLSYTFTEINTVYAVPIECIALERGGTNPFGHWLHANDAYWAYVLVQYNDDTSSYTYGYTFKDSAGYGLYPTSQAKLNEQGKQIQTGLELSRPQTGKVTSITDVDNWSGFAIDSTTDLIVLKAASEGEVGDGKTTCTLQQKGDNYQEAQENSSSNITSIYFDSHYVRYDSFTSYSYTFSEDGSAKFYMNCEPQESYPSGTVTVDGQTVYAGGSIIASGNDDMKMLSLIDGSGTFVLDETGVCSASSNNVNNELPILASVTQFIKDGDIDIASVPSWFSKIDNIKSITFENKISIPSSVVADDYSMFGNGKVMTFLREHPSESGAYDLVIQGDGKLYANPNSFYAFAIFTSVNKFNNIGLLDTSKVINMSHMFYGVPVYELNLSSWDTRKVTDMSYMFKFIGPHEIPNKSVKLTVGFDTSNVTNMEGMFYTDGTFAPVMTLSLGNKFDTSKVTNMSHMFVGLGHNNQSLSLDLGNKFDTSNVVNMDYMFHSAGFSDDNFRFDCSNWNVDKVTSHIEFGDASKIVEPNWVN